MGTSVHIRNPIRFRLNIIERVAWGGGEREQLAPRQLGAGLSGA